MICLLDLILYFPVNNFSVMLKQLFLGWASTKHRIKCLAQEHNAVPPVRLKPLTPRSWVKHSTVEMPHHAPHINNEIAPLDWPDIRWYSILNSVCAYKIEYCMYSSKLEIKPAHNGKTHCFIQVCCGFFLQVFIKLRVQWNNITSFILLNIQTEKHDKTR